MHLYMTNARWREATEEEEVGDERSQEMKKKKPSDFLVWKDGEGEGEMKRRRSQKGSHVACWERRGEQVKVGVSDSHKTSQSRRRRASHLSHSFSMKLGDILFSSSIQWSNHDAKLKTCWRPCVIIIIIIDWSDLVFSLHLCLTDWRLSIVIKVNLPEIETKSIIIIIIIIIVIVSRLCVCEWAFVGHQPRSLSWLHLI